MMPSSTPSITSPATSTKPATHAMQQPQVSSQPERPKTSSSLVGQKSTPASSQPQTATACSTPVLNCERIENRIRKDIQHSWRSIMKLQREGCWQNRRNPSVRLPGYSLCYWGLSEEEINQITTKYDFKKNGKFAYRDFLQSYVERTDCYQGMLPLHYQEFTTSRESKMCPGPQTMSFCSAMMRIQPQILHCWRPMKRTFKSYEESRTGMLNIADFRQMKKPSPIPEHYCKGVNRPFDKTGSDLWRYGSLHLLGFHEYKINLTEEELFNILEYYDKVPLQKYLRMIFSGILTVGFGQMQETVCTDSDRFIISNFKLIN